MQKESAAWLIVRTFGLIFLCISLYQGFNFFIEAFVSISQWINNAHSGQNSQIPILRLEPFFSFVFFLSLGIYLLRRGTKIHRWLIREGANS